ncbi:MAG: hypothetical protein ACREND_10430, partial [Gemmatimonadaceae bacterium]
DERDHERRRTQTDTSNRDGIFFQFPEAVFLQKQRSTESATASGAWNSHRHDQSNPMFQLLIRVKPLRSRQPRQMRHRLLPIFPGRP